MQCKRGNRRGRTRNTKSEVSDPHEAHHHHHHHHHQAFFTTDLQLCTLECAKVPAQNLAILLGHLDLRSVPQNHEYWLLRALSSPMQECNYKAAKIPGCSLCLSANSSLIWKYGCPVNSRQPNEEVNSPRETQHYRYLSTTLLLSQQKNWVPICIHITGM